MVMSLWPHHVYIFLYFCRVGRTIAVDEPSEVSFSSLKTHCCGNQFCGPNPGPIHSIGFACISLDGGMQQEVQVPCNKKCKCCVDAPPQLTIALKLSYYLFIIAKLFKVKDGCLKFVHIGKKIPGLRRFWTVTSTPG